MSDAASAPGTAPAGVGAAPRARRSIAERVAALVDEGKLYEAQQMYLVAVARSKARKRWGQLEERVMEGTALMVDKGQFQCATELAKLALDAWAAQGLAVDDALLEKLKALATLFPQTAISKEPLAIIDFLKAALSFSKTGESTPLGMPYLHSRLALAYWKGRGDYAAAQKHFVKGTQPAMFALMLTEWAAKGNAGERDLFYARGIFLYLCLSNLRDAFVLYDKLAPGVDTPLFHFLRFLLLTLQRDAAPLFTHLRERYASSLARDPAFAAYMAHIGKVYFHLQPPAQGGLAGMMGQLLSSMGGGGGGGLFG